MCIYQQVTQSSRELRTSVDPTVCACTGVMVTVSILFPELLSLELFHNFQEITEKLFSLSLPISPVHSLVPFLFFLSLCVATFLESWDASVEGTHDMVEGIVGWLWLDAPHLSHNANV